MLGIVSGVITSGVLGFLTSFMKNTVLPWYKKLVYRGADVSGSWIAKRQNPRPDGSSSLTTYTLTLNQKAEFLSGSFQIDYGSNDKSFISTFNVEGEYWEGYFTLIFRSSNKKEYSQGTMLMKAVQGGQGMEGHICFRDVVQDKSVVIDLILVRIKSHEK